jgi:uncharacterized RDD family membrane protein YckC
VKGGELSTGLSLARRRNRVLAWLLDVLIGALLATPIIVWMGTTSPSPLHSLAVAVLAIGLLAFWAACDGSPRGATPGKRVMGIRVVDARHGGQLGYPRGAARRAAYAAGGACLMIGWLWFFVDAEREALHDKAPGSVVVTANDV